MVSPTASSSSNSHSSSNSNSNNHQQQHSSSKAAMAHAMACSAGDKLRASVHEIMRNIEGGWNKQQQPEAGIENESSGRVEASTSVRRRSLDGATTSPSAAAAAATSSLESALSKMFGSCTTGDEAAILAAPPPPLTPHTRSSSTMSSSNSRSRSRSRTTGTSSHGRSKSSSSPSRVAGGSSSKKKTKNDTPNTSSSSTRTPPLAPTASNNKASPASSGGPRKSEYGEHIYAQLFFDDQTSPPPPPPSAARAPKSSPPIGNNHHSKSSPLYKTPPRRKYSVIQPYMGPLPQREKRPAATTGAATSAAAAATDGLHILLTNTFDDGISAISAYTLEAMVQSDKLGLLSFDSTSLLNNNNNAPAPALAVSAVATSEQQKHQQNVLLDELAAEQQRHEQLMKQSITSQQQQTNNRTTSSAMARHSHSYNMPLVLNSRDTQPTATPAQYTSLKTLKESATSLPVLVLQSAAEPPCTPKKHSPAPRTRASSRTRSGSTPRSSSRTRATTRSQSQPRPRIVNDDDNNDYSEPPTLGASRSPFFDGRSTEDDFVVQTPSLRTAPPAAAAPGSGGTMSPMSRSSTLTTHSSINSFHKMWNQDERHYWSQEAVQRQQQQQPHSSCRGGGVSNATTSHFASIKSGYGTKRVKSQGSSTLKTTATTQCTSVSSSTAWGTISSFPQTLDAVSFRADEEDLLEKQFIVSGVRKAQAAALAATAAEPPAFEVDFDGAFMDPDLVLLAHGDHMAEI